ILGENSLDSVSGEWAKKNAIEYQRYLLDNDPLNLYVGQNFSYSIENTWSNSWSLDERIKNTFGSNLYKRYIHYKEVVRNSESEYPIEDFLYNKSQQIGGLFLILEN